MDYSFYGEAYYMRYMPTDGPECYAFEARAVTSGGAILARGYRRYMNIPNLKRIRISSEQELRTWLAKNPDQEAEVMLVTHNETSSLKYVSREQVGDALTAHGWKGGPRNILNATLIGHVISKHAS